jgi:hypothetical protein
MCCFKFSSPDRFAASYLAGSKAFLEKSSVSARFRKIQGVRSSRMLRSQFLCGLTQQYLPILHLPSSPLG